MFDHIEEALVALAIALVIFILFIYFGEPIP